MNQLLFDKRVCCQTNQTIVSEKLICMNILVTIIFIRLQSCFLGQSFIEQVMLLHVVSVFTHICFLFTKTQSYEPKWVVFGGKPVSFGKMNILIHLICCFHQRGSWEGCH